MPVYEQRLSQLKANLPNLGIHRTEGLAHGYVKSIILSKTKFCFQLEHDWLFLKDRIHHSDLEILDAMRICGISHFKFNQGANVKTAFDKTLLQETVRGVPFCRTPGCSNNPHFIDRPAYIEKYLHLIDVGAEGSGGIELLLGGVPSCGIYGPLDHPPAIQHIDGRARLRRMRHFIGPHGVRLMMRSGLAERVFQFQDYLGKLM